MGGGHQTRFSQKPKFDLFLTVSLDDMYATSMFKAEADVEKVYHDTECDERKHSFKTVQEQRDPMMS